MTNLNPAAMRRLLKEIKQLRTDPPEGIRIVTDEENMLDLTGIIAGPEGTPYEGGYFRIKFNFTEEFPNAPPKCWFVTKIFHPNVSRQGEICVNTLKKDWKREYGIAHILVTIKCLLIYPNPESALDEAAGKLLLEKYDDYCKHARMFTSVHATPKVPPPEFDTPASSSTDSTSSTATKKPTTDTTAAPAPSTKTNTEPSAPIASPTKNSSSVTILQPPTVPKVTSSLANPLAPTPPASQPIVVTSKTILSKTNNIPATSVMSVGPLQPSTSNTNIPVSSLRANANTVKTSSTGGGLKRPATNSAGEKRKKGLKRL
jgi:ubiquitin-conjugating enzyme E2 S